MHTQVVPSRPFIPFLVCSVWTVLAPKEDWSVPCDVLSGHCRQGGGAIYRDDDGPSGWSRGQGPAAVHLPYRVIR